MLKMGCAQADITPDHEVYLRGYASRNALSREVEENILLGVIVLKQEEKHVLILTCDHLGITIGECNAIRLELMRQYPVFREEDIFISASHTHFAPGFSPYIVYTPGGELPLGVHRESGENFSFFMEKLSGAVKEALQNLEEVRLLQADLKVSSVAFNRRTEAKSDGKVTTNYLYPDDPENWEFPFYDPTLHAWKFMKKDDQPKALLARYGCHPVTGGYSPYRISADYVGYFRQAITREMHCPAFFMQGTAGDVVPLSRNGSSRRYIGETLSNAVLLGKLMFRDTTDFTLKTAIHTLNGKTPCLAEKDPAAMEKKWQETVNAVRQGTFEGDFYLEGLQYSYYLEFGAVEETELPIHLLQLGDTPLLGLPFEVLTGVGTAIREQIPEAVVVSHCGGYEGYLPMEKDFPKGGYETDLGTVFAPDTGDRLAGLAAEKLETF